jgi:hypothetical protein
VYAGGEFTSIGGQARNYIAALDASTGSATGWNPNAENYVLALAVSGTTVYAGGGFTSIGGQTRNKIAALDASTGSATGWNPNAVGEVSALAVSGTTVYAGGDFTSIGGQTRNRIAALDASTGSATSWNPNANLFVYALAVSGTTVYAGGEFTSIGGATRNYIAALDSSTGNATSWDPNASGQVYALAVSGTTVYAGGDYHNIGGQTRFYFAALDASTGSATSWNPNASNPVYALALSLVQAKVYAGGDFTSILNDSRGYFVGLTNPDDAALPITLASFTAAMNPNGPGVLLEWTTISEINNYGFEIERRSVGSNTWHNVGFVAGAGTSSAVQKYSFTDRTVSPGRYAYRLKQVDNNGTFTFSGAAEVQIGLAAREFKLEQNYPNPFNPSTVIRYGLPSRSHVKLEIYNTLGQQVALLVDEEQEARFYERTWHATVATGLYFYRLEAVAADDPARSFVQVRKMVLVK